MIKHLSKNSYSIFIPTILYMNENFLEVSAKKNSECALDYCYSDERLLLVFYTHFKRVDDRRYFLSVLPIKLLLAVKLNFFISLAKHDFIVQSYNTKFTFIRFSKFKIISEPLEVHFFRV